MTCKNAELKTALLEARTELKQLFAEGLSKEQSAWPVETATYRFFQLSSKIIPPPNYGFGVYLKQLDSYGLWYRDTSQEERPLKLFLCNKSFEQRLPI